VKKLNSKALEVLDICLASESPEVKAKVYEIIEISELDASDPMFLVLALTGQMRVLLEAAPADLSKLLTNWKETSASSIQQIQVAVTQVKATQQQQADSIRQTLEIVANNYVDDIKEAGMATTSAIASANSETLSQARLAALRAIELKDEVVTLRTSVESDRKTNEDVLKVLLQRLGQTSGGLSTAIGQINEANAALRRLQQNTVWIKMADWFSPLAALAIVALVGFGSGIWVTWLKYNDSTNSLGRDLVEWNRERIIKCADDKNLKCTIWLVPPEQRKK
jgi:hypothetical protein